jgi:hypothetical protein
MANLGKLAKLAKQVVDKSGDKIAAGVDKATDKIDSKTGGKYKDKLEKLDNLAAKLDKTEKPEADTTAEAVAGSEPMAPEAAATPAPAETDAGGALAPPAPDFPSPTS